MPWWKQVGQEQPQLKTTKRNEGYWDYLAKMKKAMAVDTVSNVPKLNSA